MTVHSGAEDIEELTTDQGAVVSYHCCSCVTVRSGAEYIEALTTDQGAVVSYHCKLCDCSFTDPAARLSHLNGRRHLLMYNVRPTFLPAPLIQFV